MSWYSRFKLPCHSLECQWLRWIQGNEIGIDGLDLVLYLNDYVVGHLDGCAILLLCFDLLVAGLEFLWVLACLLQDGV